MKNFLKKITAAVLALAMVITVSATPAQAAKKKVKLSKKSITMTAKGVPYSLSVKNTSKNSKISWSFSSADPDSTPISISTAADKRSVTIMALTGGSGTITCKVGKKKYKCKYKVTLPVVPNFQTLTDYIDQNGIFSPKGTQIYSDPQTSGDNTYSVYLYSHYGDTDSICIDMNGGNKTTQSYWSLTFLISADGNVRTFSLNHRQNSIDDWSATIDEVKASKIAGKNTSAYNIVFPQYLTTPQIASYQKQASAQFKSSLALLDTYLNQKFGYGVDTLGF